jgi:hypothetical protein
LYATIFSSESEPPTRATGAGLLLEENLQIHEAIHL